MPLQWRGIFIYLRNQRINKLLIIQLLNILNFKKNRL